jgi:RNA polymerase sigma factor (sigma-70 family)
MANQSVHLLAKHLRNLSVAARTDNLSDGELLQRFAAQSEEDAFAALVRRHGPMVLRVCQRVLHDAHDAEDAFQATFLVLSRKAASLRRADSVGCFLHGVAYRLALKARTQRARQRLHESRAAVEKHASDPLAELSVREGQAILDEELAHLPEKYRAPLVLCCLEGRTRDEAARQLGWSAKLVKSRLEQGRTRLHQRLTRRGLTLPAALGATLLADEAASAALPAALVRVAVQAARAWPGNDISAPVALLAEGALRSTGAVKAKVVVGLLLLTSVLAAGVGVVALPPVADAPGSPSRKAAEPAKAEEKRPPRTDRYGDPLPPGAIARIGTVRFRESDAIFALAYSPDGKTLFTASRDDSLGVWETARGRERFRFQGQTRSEFDWHHNEVAVTPDGKTAAAWLAGGLYSWDVSKPKVVRALSDAAAGFDSRHGLAFSLQGRLLAAGWSCKEDATRLWAKGTATDPLVLKNHKSVPNSLNFSSDGKTLASACSDGTARLWDVAAGKELHTLRGVKGQLGQKVGGSSAAASSLAFSPDSTTLAVGGSYGSIELWDKTSGRELARIVSSSNRNLVQALAFSPDGKTLAAGYENGTVRFWEAITGKMRREWVTHTGSLLSLAFSPDNRLLASAGSDTTVLIWPANAVTKPRDVSVKELEMLWTDLAGDDASKAYRTIGDLSAASQQTVAFLKTRLRPIPEVDAKRLARLIADLDDARFAVREKTSAQLAKYGDRAEPALRKTLEGQPSLEVRRRIEAILEELNRPFSTEQLREARAVEVLERIGTLPAQEVLRALAEGAPGARLTREAKAALERLTHNSTTVR